MEKWQFSHGKLVVMWVVLTLVLVLNFVVTPAKLASWQVAHPDVMPVWFITPGLQLAGLVVTAAAVVTWHSSQGWFSVSGMCGLGAAAVPFALVALWHDAQPAAVRPAWFIGVLAKLTVLLWHVSHGWVVVMWVR